MTEFAKFSDLNVGGFQDVHFVFPTDISAFTVGTGYVIYLTFAQGKNWRDIYITPQSFSGGGSTEETEAGIIHKYQFSCKHPKDSRSLISDLELLQATGAILKIKDGNALERIYGTPLNPAKVKFRQLLPGEVQNYNGYEITFEISSPDPAYLLPA